MVKQKFSNKKNTSDYVIRSMITMSSKYPQVHILTKLLWNEIRKVVNDLARFDTQKSFIDI